MKELLNKKHIVKIPLYSGVLIVYTVKNWKKINKEYGFNLDTTFYSAPFYVIKDDGYCEYHLPFIEKPSCSTIAHETVHIVNQIFKNNLIKLDIDNDEPQAYLTEWVFNEIYNYYYR